jgi:2-polyprenyl-3-methyl-5-hydroxy-6-metoxy-1,4-benzoquinol methylase
MTTSRERFDALANNYDQEHTVVRANAIASAVRRQVDLNSEMDVLDFGAGTGLVTLALQPYVRSVTAVDTSKGMLDILDAKTQDRQIANVRTLLYDLVEEGPLELRFDLIASAMTLHHVSDVAGILRVFRQMLRPGGTIAIADLDAEDGSFHPDKTGVVHFGFERGQLSRLLRDAGFGKIKVCTAHKASKEIESGEVREFSVFLITGEIV